MKQFFVIGLLCLFSVLTDAGAQNFLKRKPLKKSLIRIDSLIQAGEYEKAMLIFDSKQDVILEENVPAKYNRMYFINKMTLSEKKRVFDEMNSKVEGYKELHLQKVYCLACELLKLELGKDNSYEETRQLKDSLNEDMLVSKAKCDGYSDSLKHWNSLLDSEQFEALHHLLLISENDKHYFYSGDLKSFDEMLIRIRMAKEKADYYSGLVKQYREAYENEAYESMYKLPPVEETEKQYWYRSDLDDFNFMMNGLRDKQKKYQEVADFLDRNSASSLTDIDFLMLDVAEALNILDTLQQRIAGIDMKIKEAPGVNPELEKTHSKQRASLEARMVKLRKYIEEREIVRTTTFRNANITSLNLGDFSPALADLQKSLKLRAENKQMGAEKMAVDAKQIADEIIVPDKKVLIQVDSLIYYRIRIDSSSIVSVTFYADASMKEGNGVMLEIYKDSDSADNRELLTPDPVLEKLAGLPQESSGLSGKDFTLLVQFVPLGWGLFGESKYYFISPEAGIKIYTKLLDVY